MKIQIIIIATLFLALALCSCKVDERLATNPTVKINAAPTLPLEVFINSEANGASGLLWRSNISVDEMKAVIDEGRVVDDIFRDIDDGYRELKEFCRNKDIQGCSVTQPSASEMRKLLRTKLLPPSKLRKKMKAFLRKQDTKRIIHYEIADVCIKKLDANCIKNIKKVKNKKEFKKALVEFAETHDVDYEPADKELYNSLMAILKDSFGKSTNIKFTKPSDLNKLDRHLKKTTRTRSTDRFKRAHGKLIKLGQKHQLVFENMRDKYIALVVNDKITRKDFGKDLSDTEIEEKISDFSDPDKLKKLVRKSGSWKKFRKSRNKYIAKHLVKTLKAFLDSQNICKQYRDKKLTAYANRFRDIKKDLFHTGMYACIQEAIKASEDRNLFNTPYEALKEKVLRSENIMTGAIRNIEATEQVNKDRYEGEIDRLLQPLETEDKIINIILDKIGPLNPLYKFLDIGTKFAMDEKGIYFEARDEDGVRYSTRVDDESVQPIFDFDYTPLGGTLHFSIYRKIPNMEKYIPEGIDPTRDYLFKFKLNGRMENGAYAFVGAVEVYDHTKPKGLDKKNALTKGTAKIHGYLNEPETWGELADKIKQFTDNQELKMNSLRR